MHDVVTNKREQIAETVANEIVWNTVENDLPTLRAQAAQLIGRLSEAPNPK